MAATMVIDPRPDGWKIINADDFSNAGSNGRVASFIEKIEGISSQKTLDDAARTIGASDWVTVDDLDDDILESRKSALSPFDVEDNEYELYSSDEDVYANTTDRKGDSLTTASSGMYTFWGNRPISAPPVNNAHEMFYGIEGDRNKSIHCHGWRIDDRGPDYGRCQVIVKTPDEMTLETAVVTRWNDAKQWFMDYCTNNQSYVDGILDSVNGVFASQRRFSNDMYRLYDEDTDTDSQSNDFYGSISYGDPNDIGDFVLMTAYGPDGADGHMECAVRSNNEVINQFDASSWEDAKEQFHVQSEVDGMYDDDVFQHVNYPVDLGVDYLNPYSPRNFANKRSSMRKIKKTSAYEFGVYDDHPDEDDNGEFNGSICYGTLNPYEILDYIIMCAYGENGINGPMVCNVIDTGTGENVNRFEANSWEDAKAQFIQQSEVNKMYDNLLLSHKDSHKKASVRKADGDWAYWGESDNSTSKEYYYGEIDNENNSVMLYTEDQDPSDGLDCRVVAPDGDIITTFTAPTWEDAKAYFDSVRVDYDNFDGYVFTLYDWENRDTASHDKGAKMNKKAYNQEFSIWGEDIIENTANQFSASINYGEEGEENNSVIMYADGDNGIDGPMECTVTETGWGETINEFTASSWEDAKDQFDTQSNLDGAYDNWLVTQEEEFNHLNGIGASRKKSANVDYEYYGATRDPFTGLDGIAYYGPENDEENSLTIEITGDDQTGYDCVVVSPSGANVLGEFTSNTWDLIPAFLEDVVEDNGLDGYLDRYLESVSNYNDWRSGLSASRKRASVENSNGHVFDDSEWDAIVQNMDPDIREQLSENLAPCSNQEFFDAYADAYYNKYGEEWELDKADPQW